MKGLKFNSQICTTREQSERLLALGLKKETADMVHFFSRSLAQDWTIVPLDENETASQIQDNEIPAWSLHRLVELIDEPEHIARWIGVQIANDYDYTVDCIEWLIKAGYFNKEYLNGTTED